MERIVFVLKLAEENRSELLAKLAAMKPEFEKACDEHGVGNFSMWHMVQYAFGYGETENGDMRAFDAVFAELPDGVSLVCAPGTMPMMYHDLGIIREDKSLIRHRVFATKLKPGCAEEYKRRHDGLIASRGDTVKDGPESNFTIWHGDGHIFGYCELVKAYDAIEPTQEQKEWSKAWETRQLEIMDWITDDVDWLTGEKHAPVKHIM